MPRRRSTEKKSVVGLLLELRKRLFLIAAGVLVGAIAGWLLSDLVWAALRDAITVVAEDSGRVAGINYQGVTTAFDLKVQLSVTLGIVLSSPFWLYQVFALFVPVLRRTGRRYAFGFLAAAVPLFAAGCGAGWMLFPHIVQLMTGFAALGSASLINARDYLDFAMKLVLATGVAFVLPVVIVALNFLGVLSARAILRGWRVAILLITLFTAIATPAADVLSMVVLAVPMVLLYFAAVGVAALHDRRAAKRAAAADLVGAR